MMEMRRVELGGKMSVAEAQQLGRQEIRNMKNRKEVEGRRGKKAVWLIFFQCIFYREMGSTFVNGGCI